MFGDWQEGEEKLRVELEETLIDMLSGEEEDEEVMLDMEIDSYRLPDSLCRQATSH